jgi:hypothetical protein
MLIDKTLETMSEEWDRISEKFRFQNGTFYLYDIVENFLGIRKSNEQDFNIRDSQATTDDGKYVCMNYNGMMEIVEEEPSPMSNNQLFINIPDTKHSPLLDNEGKVLHY